ncbi:response regulator [Rhodopirellula sp. SWK7]|uniref:response regulator n=1 Tax=Rhodopirellula sp. SWK7 TaxID=595460 RepID=UPI0002BDC6A8|nr:response regulator [Rhodopirellula sp. SWK7]EMI41527.1 multi-sensor hybrid histidine kinase [Rhodopirellula sp. SWK7]
MSQKSEINREGCGFDPAHLKPPPGVTLESILHTDALAHRPSRATDHETEAKVLLTLAEHLANSPHDILQKIATETLELLRVGSAGVSLISEETGDFYWPAIAGQWSSHIGKGTPRNFGPCAVVMQRDSEQLFHRPERYFPYLASALPPIHESLLIPFYLNGEAVGTVWAVSHDEDREFDTEDVRLLTSLSKFASAAYSTLDMVVKLESERERLKERETKLRNSVDELEDARTAALNLMEDAVADRKLVEDLNQKLSLTAARDAFRVALADSLRTLADPTEIQAEAAQVLGVHLGVSRTLYVDVDPDESHIVIHRDYTFGVPSVVGEYELSDFGPLVFDECHAGRTLVVHDVQNDPRIGEGDREIYPRLQIRAFIAVPLLKAGRLVAVFGVQNASPRQWTADEIVLVEDTAERTWAIVERAKIEQALRESEERFRMLADNMSQFAWTCDDLGSINWYNQRWLDYTGSTLEEMRDWAWTKIHHPDHVDRVRESVMRARETGEVWDDTFPLRGKDGTYRWFLSRAVPIKDKSGKILRWFGTNTDITDQREAEEALRKSEKKARQASISKSEFLANMSHEIRTPMAAILGHADVLLTHIEDVDNRACVETIKRNGNHLLDIINDILDLSRIEAGKLDVEPEKCNLTEILQDIWSLMQVRVEEKTIDLSVIGEGTLPSTIETDPKRLKQVLINLIGNAIKFTEHGQVKLQASHIRRNNEHRIRFDVQDTGIGISKEHMSKLFKPFSQADSSVSRRFGGTGLGLSISKRLVSMLGGQLTVDSEEGVGSTFRVEIPVGDLNGVPFEKLQIDKVSHQTERPRNDVCLDCRVLLVDDRRDVRFVGQHILDGAGAMVVTATDGREAIETIRGAEQNGQPFDVVVMDMQMPVMDGYAATAELRATGFERPIIAMTADAMAGDKERCLEVGCDDYQSKPVDAKELIEKVRRLAEILSIDALRSQRERRKEELRNEAQYGSGSVHVLVVDDSVDAARATAMLLSLEGYRTTICHSGTAAKNIVADVPPDCVVMDLGLPDIQGCQVVRELRNHGYTGLVIALSGRSEEHEKQLAFEAGFDHFVVKPAGKGELEELITTSLPTPRPIAAPNR